MSRSPVDVPARRAPPSRRRPAAALLPLGAIAAGFSLCPLASLAEAPATPRAESRRGDASDDASGRPAQAPSPAASQVSSDASPAASQASSGASPAIAQAGGGRPSPVGEAARAAAVAEAEQLAEISVTGRKETDATSLRATTTGVAKGRQDIRDVPQSVTVLTEKMVEDLKLNNLKDALHYTAGITFAAAENGTDQDIRLRGFPIGTTGDLMIDGMRDPSQYERDTFAFERIEVMRGSASMLFGRGSTGGVVNQVSKKPELVDQSDVVGSAGSRGYFRTTIDTNVRTGETSAVRLNAMETRANNDGPRTDKHGVAPAVRWGVDTPDEFLLSAFYLNVDNIPQGAVRWLNNGPGTQGTIAPIDPENFYGTNSDYQKGRATYGTGAWVHRFDDGGTLHSQVRTGVYDRQQWSTAAGAAAAPFNPVTVTLSNFGDGTVLSRAGLTPRKDRYVNTYVQSDYTNVFETFGLKHDVLAGVDAAREQAKRYQNNGFRNPLGTRPNTTVGHPDDGTSLAFAPIYRDSSNYQSRAIGAFVQDLVQVTSVVKLLGGVRYDHFAGDFNTLNYSNATGALTSTTSTHLANSPWSYRGGVLFQPSTTASFHVSYGTSFNTSADTYQFVTPQNANTPPEKSRNIEVGAKLDWLDNDLSTRVAIFRTDKYNERTTDLDFAGTSYLLSGRRHSQGLELDVAGRITDKLEMYLSLSYIPTAIIDATGSTQAAIVGQRVGLAPRTGGGAYVTYEATSQLRFGFGVHGSSRNYALSGTTGAAQSTNKAPGYAVADLLVEYKFTPDLFAQLNVLNLKNKLYADQLYPAFTIAGAPRTVQGTLGVRF